MPRCAAKRSSLPSGAGWDRKHFIKGWTFCGEQGAARMNLKATSIRLPLAAAQFPKASPSSRSSVTSNLYLTVSKLLMHRCLTGNQLLICTSSSIVKIRYQMTDMTGHPKIPGFNQWFSLGFFLWLKRRKNKASTGKTYFLCCGIHHFFLSFNMN